jgi:hypothetical protein
MTMRYGEKVLATPWHGQGNGCTGAGDVSMCRSSILSILSKDPRSDEFLNFTVRAVPYRPSSVTLVRV